MERNNKETLFFASELPKVPEKWKICWGENETRDNQVIKRSHPVASGYNQMTEDWS